MKKAIYIFIVLSFILTSCDENDLQISSTSNNYDSEILSFKTVEEFNSTLSKVNSMTVSERKIWEKQQGFTSYGTICDEFYETIKPEQFKSFEEVKEFLSNHSDKVLLTERAGELYCEPQGNSVAERFLMNKDCMYRIGESTYLRSKDGIYEIDLKDTNKSLINKVKVKSENLNKVSSAIVTEYVVGDTSTIGVDHYRMMFTLKTYNKYYNYKTYVVREVSMDNYARWLAIWWLRTYVSDYIVKVRGTDIAYGDWFLDGPFVNDEGVKSKFLLNDELFVAGGSVNSQPKLTWYNIVASNEKECSINSSKTF